MPPSPPGRCPLMRQQKRIPRHQRQRPGTKPCAKLQARRDEMQRRPKPISRACRRQRRAATGSTDAGPGPDCRTDIAGNPRWTPPLRRGPSRHRRAGRRRDGCKDADAIPGPYALGNTACLSKHRPLPKHQLPRRCRPSPVSRRRHRRSPDWHLPRRLRRPWLTRHRPPCDNRRRRCAAKRHGATDSSVNATAMQFENADAMAAYRESMRSRFDMYMSERQAQHEETCAASVSSARRRWSRTVRSRPTAIASSPIPTRRCQPMGHATRRLYPGYRTPYWQQQ